ncbi:MAG TPA: TonB-dependent siderophore receptor [Woeseiaceae bacterium]|nr:TonB-dependent siderophore receptor [Woeseiaceae bacterium]
MKSLQTTGRHGILHAAALCLAAFVANPAQSQTDQSADGNIEEIVVTGTRDQGYLTSQTDALGLPVALSELPASVTVISDDLLEDLGARSMAAVLPYVAGVSNADNGGLNTDEFTIRGFSSTNNYVNGIRQSITAEGRPALDTVERIEIVKGPSGVEGSLTSPGGFVNIITKKPQEKFDAQIFGSVGDANFYRFGGDVTGKVVQGVNVRLIAAYEEKQQWRPGRQSRPVTTVNPSVSWEITPNTDLLVEYEYRKQNDPLDRGTIYARGILPDSDFLPRDFSIHQKFDDLELTNQRYDVDLTHRINSVFSVRAHYQSVSQEDSQIAARNADSGPDGPLFEDDGITYSGNSIIDVYVPDFGSHLTSETVQLEVKAGFDAGSTSHAINLGWSQGKNRDRFIAFNDDFKYLFGFASYDVLNPTDSLTLADFGITPTTPPSIYSNFIRGDEIDSGYGQWMGQWTDRFRTLVSVRYDNIGTYSYEDLSGIDPATLQQGIDDGTLFPDELFSESAKEDTSSYRLASSYDFSSSLTGFVGYAESAEPQPGFTRNGDPISSKLNRSFEGGIKLKMNSDAALLTLTAYQIEQTNIAILDPSNDPSEFFLAPLGSARINGVELEIVGKLNETVSIFSGISAQDSKITASDEDIVGNEFPNVPKFQGSVFVNVNGAIVGADNLDVGIGVVHQGSRQANSGNQYQLPSYERIDLGISYYFAQAIEVRLQVNNVFDETFYTAAQDSIFGSDQVAVGDERLMQLTVWKRF